MLPKELNDGLIFLAKVRSGEKELTKEKGLELIKMFEFYLNLRKPPIYDYVLDDCIRFIKKRLENL